MQLDHIRVKLRRSNRNFHRSLKEILSGIAPGESHLARARKIGISRQTLYDWMSGKSRPSFRKAKRLSQLTGIPARDIHP